MLLEAVRDLSVFQLLSALTEKLSLECTRLREVRLPPVASVASTKLELESLETSARDILRLLPTFRNMLQPVNRLPPEILSRIAQCSLDKTSVDARSIVPLTHVCRYWRESIVSAPENWTLISNGRNGLAALSLERAKAAHLEVTIDACQFRADPGSFRLIIPHLKNIGTLFVCDLPGIEELTRALPNFPRSTPNLRSLTLLCTYSSAEWDPFIDPFKSLPPTLKCLSLFKIPLYPSLLNLKALTDLTLRNHWFDVHLDTLLDFLEQNRSLETATLDVRFTDHPLRYSRRRAPVKNRLRHLSVSCNNPMNAKALVSNIALQRGAHLEIISLDQNTGLNDILSDISTTHLSNLPSSTLMEYQSYPRGIRLLGPNGGFSFSCLPSSSIPFVEFPLLSLAKVRELRLRHSLPERLRSSPDPPVFHLSSFPILETLAVECDTDLSDFLSPLLSNPSSSPSLKTFAFLNCAVTKGFMKELTQFAADRKNTTSAWLYHVVIVGQGGNFPTGTSILELGKHVSVVDVRFGTKLPTDLT